MVGNSLILKEMVFSCQLLVFAGIVCQVKLVTKVTIGLARLILNIRVVHGFLNLTQTIMKLVLEARMVVELFAPYVPQIKIKAPQHRKLMALGGFFYSQILQFLIKVSQDSSSQTHSNPCPSASSSRARRGRKSVESWLPVRLRLCRAG